MSVYLIFALILALLIIAYLVSILRRVQTQLALMKDALEDIKNGNLNRRVLAMESDMTRQIHSGCPESSKRIILISLSVLLVLLNFT